MSNTYPFTIRVTDAEGRVATLADSISVMAAPVTGSVTLSDRAITTTAETVQGVSRTTNTSFTISPSLTLSTSDGQSSTWGTGVSAAAYEVWVTPVGGATFAGSPTGAWLPLSSEHTWTEDFTANCANGQPASQVTQMSVQIRDVATSTIRASATITHNHTISPMAAQVLLSGGTFPVSVVAPEFMGAAEAALTITLRSDGVLQIFRATNLELATPFEPANEWGRTLIGSNYEVRFDVVAGGPPVALSATVPFGTWGNLGVGQQAQALLRVTTPSTQGASATLRVSIRPVGGAVLATADYTAELEATLGVPP